MEKEKFLRKDIAENEKYIGNYNVNEAAQDASNVEEAPKISKAEEILGSMPKYEDFRKKTIKSCGCIIIKDNKVFLVSTKDGHGNLFWSFPKGNQEAGESDTETALRETKEEVGLTVDILEKTQLS